MDLKEKAFKADRLVEVNGGLKHRSAGYVVKLSDARKAVKDERDAAAREIEGPYPESMFPPVTDAEMDHARQLCGDNLFARIHGEWARRWAGLVKRG